MDSRLGHSQNPLAVAGGYAVGSKPTGCAPTRYREVVLTVSKLHFMTFEAKRLCAFVPLCFDPGVVDLARNTKHKVPNTKLNHDVHHSTARPLSHDQ